jgi:hypothetical protein
MRRKFPFNPDISLRVADQLAAQFAGRPWPLPLEEGRTAAKNAGISVERPSLFLRDNAEQLRTPGTVA